MECRQWTQPDANHWRPLCTNTFQREGKADNCTVCAFPYAWDHCAQCAGGAPYRYRIVEGDIVAYGPDLLISTETVTPKTTFFNINTNWHYRRHEFGWSTVSDMFSNGVLYPDPNPIDDECSWEMTLVSEIGWRYGECLPGNAFNIGFAWSRFQSYDQFVIQDTYSTTAPKPTTKYVWPTGFGTKTSQQFTSGDTGDLLAPAYPATLKKYQAVASRCEFRLRATFVNNKMRLLAAVSEQSLKYGFSTGPSGPIYCATPSDSVNFDYISTGYPTRQIDAGFNGAIWDSEDLDGCLDLSLIPMTKTRGASEWPANIVLKAALW